MLYDLGISELFGRHVQGIRTTGIIGDTGHCLSIVVLQISGKPNIDCSVRGFYVHS